MDSQQSQTARTFDAYKDNYSDVVDAAVSFTGMSTDFFTRVKADYLLDISHNHFGSTDDLHALDVGCGVGNFHALLSPRLKSLSGVDVSPATIETASSRNKTVEYKVYDGGTLPYNDSAFDLAFTSCVMHHVPPAQWNKFAEEMHRVVRPQGLVVVFEHNPRNLLTMRAVNSCPFDDDAVLLRREETERIYKAAGFAAVESRFILSVPAFNSFFRSIDRMMGRLPFGAQYYVAAKV